MNKLFTIGVFTAFALAPVVVASVPVEAQTAAMPTCASGDPVVWENSSSKVYHMQGDSYFGKTKHGAYACKSAADTSGYHASGSTSSKAKTTASPAAGRGTPASPGPMASASSGHHHRHHKSTTASPAPAAT